jgi:hypothetical protein
MVSILNPRVAVTAHPYACDDMNMIYDNYLFGERHRATDFIVRPIGIGRAASV